MLAGEHGSFFTAELSVADVSLGVEISLVVGVATAVGISSTGLTGASAFCPCTGDFRFFLLAAFLLLPAGLPRRGPPPP
jgi:hypothetical protein